MRKKRVLSSVLATVMLLRLLISSLSINAFADDLDDYLMLHFDFTTLDNGTIVTNKGTNSSISGVVRNNDASTFRVNDVELMGKTHKALYLNGGNGSVGNYVQIQNMDLTAQSEITVSCWVNIKEYSGYQRIWDFGNAGTTSYMYLLTDGANTGFVGYASAITNGSWSDEQGVQKGTSLTTNQWIFTTVTYSSDGTMTLYEDGEVVGTTTCTVPLSDISSTVGSYIGYGQWGNDIGAMEVADFRVYSRALSGEEVFSIYGATDEARAKSDVDSIDLGDTSAVTSNLTLPTTGANGSTISWSSSDTSVVSNSGVVTRPSAEQSDATVTLTATADYNGTTSSRDFAVTVTAFPSYDDALAHDLEALDLGDLSCVTDNLSLPAHGEWGSAITWDSHGSEYLSNDGTVTRPEAGRSKQTVTLTATLTYDGETATKDFEVNILPVYVLRKIASTEDISVSTSVGVYPSLPAMVSVTYDDGTKDSLKVRWENVDSSLYAHEGIFTTNGQIVDSDTVVNASVTVEAEAAPAPYVTTLPAGLSNITLDGDNLLTQNSARAQQTLLNKDPDSMLYNFRKTYGVDTKGAEPLVGWEEPSGLLRGHGTGHYMSALALAYSSTGNSEFKDKLDYMISEMHKLQQMSKGNARDFVTVCTPTSYDQALWSTNPEEWGEGYISAYAPDHFALLEQLTTYNKIWAPYYTLHKLMAGFIDAYTYTGNEEALATAEGMGSWVHERLSNCTTAELRTQMWAMYIAGEYGGMNESMAKLYDITGEEKYLETAKMFDNTIFFDKLAQNIDDVGGRHANQHIPQIIGALSVYESSGDSYYYNVAKNFWNIVTSKYAYSIGGVGRGESFKEAYELAANIAGDTNCETCAAYNMMKLTKDLYTYDPDNAEYMDYYERTLYNQVTASQDTRMSGGSHGVTYMLPIGPGVSRSGDFSWWTCCYGTGLENHVKYQEAAYHMSEDAMYVNLYMPTTVTWSEQNVTVTQECDFPADYSKLTVSGSGSFEMKLRVPYWATAGFEVKINGEVVVMDAEPSSYISIGTVTGGDVIKISMPFTVHLDKTPDKLEGNTVASVMYGPLVMITQDSSTDYISLTLDPELNDYITDNGVNDDGYSTLTINGRTFIPMYKGWNMNYHTYFYINIDADPYAVIDKTSLQEALNKANAIINDSDSVNIYTPSTLQALKDAAGTAQEVMDNSNDLDYIDDVIASLNSAMDALKKQADKTKLLEAIIAANALDDLSIYTDESVAVLNEAFNKASAAYVNSELSVDDQSNIDALATTLQEAIDGLYKKNDTSDPSDPSNPSDPSDPSDSSDLSDPSDSSDPSITSEPSNPSGDSEDPSDSGSSSSSSSSATSYSNDSSTTGSSNSSSGKASSARTGDGMQIMIFSIAAVSLSLVLCVTYKRRKEK